MFKKKNITIFLIFVNFLSFIIGFFFLEEHGASKLDALLHTYPAIEGLKNNFFDNILTYGKYGEASYPLHHIIFALLNPFESGSSGFKALSILWSALVILFFFKEIKNKFNFKNYESLFLSSLLLLSPYFRTSAYWGMTENTGLLFLIISIFLYNKLKLNFDIKNLFFVCLFSSMALYSRIQYIFICLFFYIDLFFSTHNKNKLYLTIFYIFLSIPALTLIYFWGGIIDEQWAGEFNSIVNFKTIPRTLLVIFSLIGFYSLPFLICFVSDLKLFIKENLIKFILIFLLLIVIFFIFDVNILSLDDNADYAYGQGFLANYLFKITGIQISYLLFSTLGVCVMLSISYTLKNQILIFCLLIIFSQRVHFFTEYLDPLLFVLAFCLLDIKQMKEIYKSKNLIVLEIFFMATLLGAILL